jgi:hypothetical protein
MSFQYKQKLMVGGTLIIVVCLIISGIFVAEFFAGQQEIIEEEPEEESPYDLNSISPLTNQGLILEVNRIRHRGLLDKLMQRGTSWKDKPSFYFISNIDGLEYVSKDVTSRKGVTETFFTTWDNMFQENKIQRDAEEEQEISDITLTIMERKKMGLLGLKSQNVEGEAIHLIYDYKTGRWEGDDFFNDSDGYGHYLGETFEVWFNIYQTDFDRDGIPYWTEVNILETDPKIDDSKRDPDGDGIPTSWEWKWGYDPHVYDNHSTLDPDLDGLENTEEYYMERWFANPFYQDIYIETDGMERGGIFDPPHVFWKESQQVIIERFAQHGINLYIDDGWPGGPTNGGGELLTHYDQMSQDSGMTAQYYKNHFSPDRKGIFRYVLICHNAGYCHPSEFNRYDTITVFSCHEKMIKSTLSFTPRTYRLTQAASIMHELGHSLGIGPWNVGGNDNFTFAQGKEAKKEYIEKWGNYKSVMNYYYIYDKKLVDYSDGTHGEGDVNDWEMFDLTFFQQEAKVVEDPSFELPGHEEISFMETVYSHLPRYTWRI